MGVAGQPVAPASDGLAGVSGAGAWGLFGSLGGTYPIFGFRVTAVAKRSA